MVEKNRRLTGVLRLEGVSLTLPVGAFAFERIEPRKILLDLEWQGEILAGEHPVVDYSEVCSSLKSKLEPEYLFIEQLAADTLSLLVELWPGVWTVTVYKDHPPTDPPMERASITISSK